MRSGTGTGTPTPGPPLLRLRDLNRAAGFAEHCSHIWVELLDHVVVIHATDPRRHRPGCRCAHVGQFDESCPVDVFADAVNAAIERAWMG